jgi:benzoyl-CoA-dihydrodiol lyase
MHYSAYMPRMSRNILHSRPSPVTIPRMGKQEYAPKLSFQTSPDRYRHITLEIDGPVAWIRLRIRENEGVLPHYQLKLNSYDMSVDIELADAVQRLRFERPEVGCAVVTSGQEGVFSAGANIFMLGTSSHAFKVNFCKFTNETRLYMEDATEHSGQTYIAALNGIASGGGYELPLACKEIYLVDDKRSAVALPELPYLGVLPGTGGLTRVVDKRKVRRDIADLFCTLAEGVKGKRAKEWGLVDDVFPTSTFLERVKRRAKEIAGAGRPDRRGVKLEELEIHESDAAIEYRFVTLRFPRPRAAELEIRVPDDADPIHWTLRAFRELDDALLRLRFNRPDVGLVIVRTRGSVDTVLRIDEHLAARRDSEWLANEVVHLVKRVLKRMDVTSKSFFALIDRGSCFAGSLFELALAADRAYMLETDGVAVALSGLNAGPLPMANGLTRLQTRFLQNSGHAKELRGRFDAAQAREQGLVTVTADDVDWEDEVRLAVEERASFSPDALTGMESNLRFAGPETLETKIFGRLSAWQNWIFQRPNAVGEKGALTLYGRPESPEFDWRRT